MSPDWGLDALRRCLRPCKECGAMQGNPCRTPSSRIRQPHDGREASNDEPAPEPSHD